MEIIRRREKVLLWHVAIDRHPHNVPTPLYRRLTPPQRRTC
jgi:hypothetical protein